MMYKLMASHTPGTSIIYLLLIPHQSFRIMTVKNSTPAISDQRIWMVTSSRVRGVNCFLASMSNNGAATFKGGRNINGKAERLITFVHFMSVGTTVSVLVTNSDSDTPKAFASAFSVYPLGGVPASMRCMVRTEMPDFSESSSWVIFNLSLRDSSLDISVDD